MATENTDDDFDLFADAPGEAVTPEGGTEIVQPTAEESAETGDSVPVSSDGTGGGNSGGDGPAEPDAGPTAELDIDESVPAVMRVHGSRCRLSGSIDDWCFVTILTVPDVPRIAIPEEFTAAKQDVDLSGLTGMKAAEVKALVTPSLPDNQLRLLWEHENSLERPRGVSMKAIAAEIKSRGDGWLNWVLERYNAPLSCRVAAIAIGVGDAEPFVGVCRGANDSDEFDILEEYWSRSSGRELSGYLPSWVHTVCAVRSVALDVPARRANDPGSVVHAARYAFSDSDVFPLADALRIRVTTQDSPCGIFSMFNSSDTAALKQACERRFHVERAVCLASRTA